MNKVKLLGAASLAATLMAAAPVIAATPGSTANPQPAPAATAPATPATTPAPEPHATTPVPNTGTAMNQNAAGTNESTAGASGPYARAGIGMGGYTAEQYYITKENNGQPVNNADNNNNNADMRPSQRNPILADNGSIRASKMIGTNVYNANNQKLGSVDDILIGTNGLFAVVSTNQKKVAVPFHEFKVGDSKNEGNDKLVLPNETQAKLNTQYEIHYDASNYQDWKAAHDNNNNKGYVAPNRNAENVNGAGTGVLGPRHPNNKNPG